MLCAHYGVLGALVRRPRLLTTTRAAEDAHANLVNLSKGLGPTRTLGANSPVDPKGLGPDHSASSCDGGLQPGEMAGTHPAASAGVPTDRIRRPWGLKKNVIMSTRDTQRPVVYLTQNGDCAHSSLGCRPMQFASGRPTSGRQSRKLYAHSRKP